MRPSTSPEPRQSLQLLELEQPTRKSAPGNAIRWFGEPSNLPDCQIFDLCVHIARSVRFHPESRAAVRGGRPNAGLWRGRAPTRTGAGATTG
jgi:hypothetical protein